MRVNPRLQVNKLQENSLLLSTFSPCCDNAHNLLCECVLCCVCVLFYLLHFSLLFPNNFIYIFIFLLLYDTGRNFIFCSSFKFCGRQLVQVQPGFFRPGSSTVRAAALLEKTEQHLRFCCFNIQSCLSIGVLMPARVFKNIK